eukprot:3933007-Pyramimonas_sp.AAC.1
MASLLDGHAAGGFACRRPQLAAFHRRLVRGASSACGCRGGCRRLCWPHLLIWRRSRESCTRLHSPPGT